MRRIWLFLSSFHHIQARATARRAACGIDAVWLVKNPQAGDVIRGSGGCRKGRWSRSGAGKRGGVRVIHFNRLGNGVIYLLLIYAKNVEDTIDAGSLRNIRRTLDGEDV